MLLKGDIFTVSTVFKRGPWMWAI